MHDNGVFLLFPEVPWSQHCSVPDITWLLAFPLPMVTRFLKLFCIRLAIMSAVPSGIFYWVIHSSLTSPQCLTWVSHTHASAAPFS